MIEWMFTADGWVAFLTLFAMEVVLGIDNVIFISILAAKLPVHQQANARYVGLGLALVMRIALLLTLTTIMQLTAPLFTVLGEEISGRDLVLLGGGLFLIAKATIEIHHMMEGRHETRSAAHATFGMVIAQIVVIDLVFSLDSIITAVGLTNDVNIMIAAVSASMVVMVLASGPVSAFVNRHPTTKMLALAFLVMIGAMLVAHGFDVEVPKGYVYTAMAFAVLVEGLNISARTAAARTRAAGVSTGEALDRLLARARRNGASAVQLAADDAGAVRSWIAIGSTLQEDSACSAIDWSALKSAIETRSAQGSALIDGVAHRISACVSPPDERPAALILLRQEA
ncbi:MAG: TerC family protein [Hyphomicrobiaceae bacterium]